MRGESGGYSMRGGGGGYLTRIGVRRPHTVLASAVGITVRTVTSCMCDQLYCTRGGGVGGS